MAKSISDGPPVSWKKIKGVLVLFSTFPHRPKVARWERADQRAVQTPKRSGRFLYENRRKAHPLPRFLVTLSFFLSVRVRRECIYLHVDSSHLGRAPLCPKRARWFQVSWHFSLFFFNSQEPRWLGNKALFSPGQQGQNGRFRDLSCTKIKTHTGPPNQRLSHVRLDRCVV